MKNNPTSTHSRGAVSSGSPASFKKDKIIGAKVPYDLWKRCKTVSDVLGINFSEFIRQAMDRHYQKCQSDIYNSVMLGENDGK